MCILTQVVHADEDTSMVDLVKRGEQQEEAEMQQEEAELQQEGDEVLKVYMDLSLLCTHCKALIFI
ncbi:hypothetical protein TSAR_014156 [Trichomalopsis sarcophagae]|uniref:Uncharacterized protein n=1 Tax=Trichomalopsis sarcophagae TaxID=543379 RepID=A0A232EMR4_9HYME|nr:hypothetical protein TSAR_014156 [Trichomalopsis sarcophagae]